MMTRNVNATVWNDPGVTLANGASFGGNVGSTGISSVSSDDGTVPPAARQHSLTGLGSSALHTVQSILRTNNFLHAQISDLAHNLEVLGNAFTFADPRVSLIIFGTAIVFGLVSCVFIAMLSFNTYLMAVGSTLLLVLASYEFLNEQTAQLSPQSKYSKLASRVGRVVSNVQNLLSKVPDELELQHRYPFAFILFEKEI